MTSALPVNGFMNPANTQPALAEQTTGGGVVRLDKSKEWQMELLMEKLRSKASSFKSLMESAKNVRMAMLDKRFGIDSVEKNQLQKCLDTLQHSIKVTSLQSMIERLESLSRQLGLKFVITTTIPTITQLFISSDMFYLEISLEQSGAVKDVKIQHEGKQEQQSCEELKACLSQGDFADFTAQLEGFASIYQLNADKKVKSRAFSALQSLEHDLGVLAQVQVFIMSQPFNVVHKSPVGVLEKRRGGHAMKLTYFVSPYDLIDLENKTCETLNLEAVISKKVGHSVTVCMEGSTAHKLPTSSIITVTKSATGKSTPSYAPLTGANSSMLPACFVLKLSKKMPVCLELIRRIQKVTELECTDLSAPHPLLSLIVQHASDKQLDCQHNKGLAVSLPDQQHIYFMTENKNMEGVLVGSIPFMHPAHVPQILNFLRQQALFNTIVSSCIRPMARSDPEHATIFEVSALSWQCISISLEHPFEETLATAELDLTDISALKCKLYGVSINNSEQTSDLAGKVLQRCLSIPLTMRTLIKTWETFMLNPQTIGGNSNEDIKIKEEPGTMNGANLPSRQQTQQQQQQQQPTQQQNQQQNQQQSQQPSQQPPQQSFLEAGTENSIGFPSLSGTTVSAADTTPHKASSSSTSSSSSSSSSSRKQPQQQQQRKEQQPTWPKVKSEPGEIVAVDSSSSDGSIITPLGTPTSARTPTPTSAHSGGMDLTNMDPLEILSTDKSSDYDIDSEDVMQVEPIVSVEEALKRKLKKEKLSPTRIFEENKALVSPSVSITPISSSGQNTNYNSMLTSMGLERRPGIEIIPITNLTQTSLPSSITITAINNPSKSSSSSSSSSLGDDRKERKSSSKSRDDSKLRLEKKRKRKRDSSPMGPPEKLPLKQDPLSKPVSVSIKPASESSPSRSTSPILRKFSPSPTRNNPLVLVGKASPTSLKQSSSKQSPKHSPVYSSPKHVPSSTSPKHGTSSPKHGNSGKPSMSALKSATSSPSHKSDAASITAKTKISSLAPSTSPSSSAVTLTSLSPSSSSSSSSSSLNKESRDKERKATSMVFGGSSPKSKSLTPKSKPAEEQSPGNGGATPPSSDPNKAASTQQQQARNRKGSLSAVIDKLKNAQHCTDDLPANLSQTATGAPPTNPAVKNPDVKNPAEYMVKPSSDGIKLTINKTRTKDLKSNNNNLKLPTSNLPSTSPTGSGGISPSGSGNGSPKTYTGLKPGVISGPASRKPQAQTSPKMLSTSPLTSSNLSGNSSGKTGQKLSGSGLKSGSNLLSSGLAGKPSAKSFSSTGGSLKQGSMSGDFGRAKEKARFKPGDKSFAGKAGDPRKPNTSTMETEGEKAFKLLAHASMGNLLSTPGFPLVVEGLKKQFDKNFQIPKLSARANAENATDVRSVDKVDSSSKSSSSEAASRPQNVPKTETPNTAVDFTSVPSVSSTSTESDMPTNLSMQADGKPEPLGSGRGLLNATAESKDVVDSTAGKPTSYSSGGDNMESLNLVSKNAEKFKPSDEKEQQHQAFHRVSQVEKKLLEAGITTSASVTLTPIPSSSSSATANPSSQEAVEMLLDFSTPKEVASTSILPIKTPLSLSASSSPLRKNATPPPPPPPPPLPPPSSVVLPAVPASVSPISGFPQSPSVSLHIVKSPAPSPRVIPSPHSASPCITDDELMDEALVGS